MIAKQLLTLALAAMFVVGCANNKTTTTTKFQADGKTPKITVTATEKTTAAAKAESAAKACGGEALIAGEAAKGVLVSRVTLKTGQTLESFVPEDSAVVNARYSNVRKCVANMMDSDLRVAMREIGGLGRIALQQFPLFCVLFGGCGGGSSTVVNADNESTVTFTDRSPRNTLSEGSRQTIADHKSKVGTSEGGSQTQQDADLGKENQKIDNSDNTKSEIVAP